jgi:hypothetical protein
MKKKSTLTPTMKAVDSSKVNFNVIVTDVDSRVGDQVPEGSVIAVHTELKNHYKGIWSSAMGTFEVKIEKTKCKRIRV